MKSKFGMRALGLLLVLALAGAIFVQGVSAIKDESIIEKNYVSVEDAYDHASFALTEFYCSGVLENEEKWLGATVSSNPQTIYDMNGLKLFYLFNVVKNGEKVGEIKIAASKVIGNSVITIGLQEKTLDFETLEKKAQEKAIQLSDNDCLVSTQLVCYSYPKIGIMASFSDPKSGTEKKIVIDSYYYSDVKEGDCFSYYEDIPSDIIMENLNSWTKYDNFVKNYYAENSDLSNISFQPLSEQLQESIASAEYVVLSDVPLHYQEHDYWCAVACAQMISEYYGVTRDQDSIADKMGIPTTRGATNSEQLNYYQSSIASGGLGKGGSLDYYLLYWYSVTEEIDNGRPFSIQDAGHTRVCSGYYRSGATDLTHLYFKDPGYSGSEYFEWMNELNPEFYDDNIRVQD